MRFSTVLPSLLPLLRLAQATDHTIYVGTYGSLFLYTINFDDSTNTLSLVRNQSVTTASQWLTLSHDKQNLYGTSTNADQTEFVSYAISESGELTLNTTTVAGTCIAKTIHVEAMPVAPYTVAGVPWYGDDNSCGGIMAVDDQGVLVETVQNYTYANGSALHGLAFHPTGRFLYSADLDGEKVWTHSVDSSTGAVSLVSYESIAGAPRHIRMHSGGEYLYVLLQDSSSVALYKVDNATGVAGFTGTNLTVIPEGDSESHSGATAVASANEKYLYASTRGSGMSGTGYMASFTLNADGTIANRDFIQQTTTAGGGANQIQPSPYDDSIFAVIDSSVGFVQVWKRLENGTGADLLARVDLDDGSCCSNAQWLN